MTLLLFLTIIGSNTQSRSWLGCVFFAWPQLEAMPYSDHIENALFKKLELSLNPEALRVPLHLL